MAEDIDDSVNEDDYSNQSIAAYDNSIADAERLRSMLPLNTTLVYSDEIKANRYLIDSLNTTLAMYVNHLSRLAAENCELRKHAPPGWISKKMENGATDPSDAWGPRFQNFVHKTEYQALKEQYDALKFQVASQAAPASVADKPKSDGINWGARHPGGLPTR